MSEIRPALTPKEWAAALSENDAWPPDSLWQDIAGIGDVPVGRAKHAAGAIALYGQPFGFTWEIHDALTDAVDTWRSEAGFIDPDPDDPAGEPAREEQRREYAAMLLGLAVIAALLPPRRETP